MSSLTGVVVAFVLAVEVELGVAGAEASLTVLLLVSTNSGFTTGGCDMTTGWGAAGADVLIIGFICVDPTFIVGVDCCIVLLTAAAFNIFAIWNGGITWSYVSQFGIYAYFQITIIFSLDLNENSNSSNFNSQVI